MTASSGGGFCLMVETLGLAAMTETPLVIAEVQRSGPSTGLPTRTEQSDLEFVLYASHGEFPRIVVAPGTIEQCFEAGHRAFNLAEQYQTPVIILSDLFLSNAVRTIEMDAIDFSQVTIDRGELLDYAALDHVHSLNSPDVADALAALREAADDTLLVGEVYLPAAKTAAYVEHVDMVFGFELFHAPWEAGALRSAVETGAALEDQVVPGASQRGDDG